jgi:hypothetical protein
VRTGTWDEIRGWGLPFRLDASTMPHILVREADGTFSFRQAEWDESKAGDDDTCPEPSFIGRTITSIFFFQNRLGVTSEEAVVMSRNGPHFWNFFPKTATTVVATDPIDYSVSHNRVSVLRHTIPFRDSLLLFSDFTQFQMNNGNASAFSPETVRVDVATEFEASPSCAPVGAGANVYFVTEPGNNSGVLEYFVMTDGVTNDATDVAAHVPRYIPRGVHKLVASTNEDYLMALSSRNQNSIFLYKYFWIDQDKVQSAWCEWRFPESDRILSVANARSNVYLVVQRADGVYLENIDVQSVDPDQGMPFQVLLDRKALVPTGAYNPDDRTTAWTLPYAVSPEDDISIVLGPAFKEAGREKKATADGTNTVHAEGRYDSGPVFCGKQYVFRMRFSEQFVRESKEVSAPVIVGGRLQLLAMTIIHKDSGYFQTVVQAKGREPILSHHLGTLGDAGFRLNQPIRDSIPHRFGVRAKSNQAVIDVISDRHYPITLLSAEWEGLFNLDARRL